MQIDFTPNIYQYKVYTSESRYILAIAGLQGGKTYTGCFWVNKKIEEGKKLLKEGKLRTYEGIIAAISQEQLDSSVMTKFFSIFPFYTTYHEIKRRKIIIPISCDDGRTRNIIIHLKSMEDPKYARGITANFVWLDEADYMSKDAWTVVTSRTVQTKGQILVTSSWSNSSWIYDLYINNPAEYELITWASKDNPTFSNEEWERLKRTMDPREFDREYGAKAIFGEGLIYSGIKEYGFIKQLPAGIKPLMLFLGIDYGHFDPTNLTVMGLYDDDNWYIIDEIYKTGLEMDQINFYSSLLVRQYPEIRFAIVDPSNAIVKNSMKIGIPIVDADRDIDAGISLVKNTIYQKRLYVLESKCPNHIREFNSYIYKKGLPEKGHNHAMDSVRYIIKTTERYITNLKKPQPVKQFDNFWLNKSDDGIFDLEKGTLVDRDFDYVDIDNDLYDYYII